MGQAGMTPRRVELGQARLDMMNQLCHQSHTDIQVCFICHHFNYIVSNNGSMYRNISPKSNNDRFTSLQISDAQSQNFDEMPLSTYSTLKANNHSLRHRESDLQKSSRHVKPKVMSSNLEILTTNSRNNLHSSRESGRYSKKYEYGRPKLGDQHSIFRTVSHTPTYLSTHHTTSDHLNAKIKALEAELKQAHDKNYELETYLENIHWTTVEKSAYHRVVSLLIKIMARLTNQRKLKEGFEKWKRKFILKLYSYIGMLDVKVVNTPSLSSECGIAHYPDETSISLLNDSSMYKMSATHDNTNSMNIVPKNDSRQSANNIDPLYNNSDQNDPTYNHQSLKNSKVKS